MNRLTELFLDCLGRTISRAHEQLQSVMAKARFGDRIKSVPLNEGQTLIFNRLLDGFGGKLTTAKWAKCSHDTALRDIQDLVRGEPAANRGRSPNATHLPAEFRKVVGDQRPGTPSACATKRRPS